MALGVSHAREEEGLSAKADLAIVGSVRVEAREHLDERALSRAVFAAERVHLSLLEIERDAVERAHAGNSFVIGVSGSARRPEEVLGSRVGGDDGAAGNPDSGGDLRVLANRRDAGRVRRGHGAAGDLADAGVPADPGDLVNDGALDPGARLDDRVGQDDRVANDRPRAHEDPGGQDALLHARPGLDHAAVGDHAVLDDGALLDAHGRALLRLRVHDPGPVVQVERRRVLQEVHLRLPVDLDRPDVRPVALEGKGEDPEAGLHHPRDDVLAEVVRGVAPARVVRQDLGERPAREDVDPHRGERARRLGRLLDELRDAVLLVRREDSHAGRLVARHVQRRDRQVGLLGDVKVGERGVVHLVDVVAREDEDEVRLAALDEGQVLRDRVGGALVPVGVGAAAVGLVDLDAAREAAVEVPGPAGADVLDQ